VIGEHWVNVENTLAELGMILSNAAYKLNVKPFLKLAYSAIFGVRTGFTDMLVKHIPSAKDAVVTKVEHTYIGPQDIDLVQSMRDCNAEGLLMVNVSKLYPKVDCSVFDSFRRFVNGTIHTGQSVRDLNPKTQPNWWLIIFSFG
jgi:U5 small nuclear ribonucleoprotein component